MPERPTPPNPAEIGSAPAPRVSVVVLNWNGAAFLERCLEAVQAQSFTEREVLLVDNGSSDGSESLVRAWGERPGVRAFLLEKNTGFCGGNNLAFRHARGEWVALLNNDAVPEPGWLENLVRRGDPARKIGMVGSKILFADPPGVIDKAGHLIWPDGQNRGRGTGQPDTGQYDTEEEILWPDGCAALYHRDLLRETGGFDETFFAYADDADLGLRARLLGWTAGYAPDAVVRHLHSMTAGSFSPLKIMLVERNRIFLALKNFPLSLLLQNPWWMVRRFWWLSWGAVRVKGSSGRFVEQHGRLRLLKTLAWAWLSALKKLPPILRARRRIQREKRLSGREVKALLRRWRIDVRELTLRD